MTCSIRYCRPGLHEDAGLLIIKRTEYAAYKARLEASGYIVLSSPGVPPFEIQAAKSL